MLRLSCQILRYYNTLDLSNCTDCTEIESTFNLNVSELILPISIICIKLGFMYNNTNLKVLNLSKLTNLYIGPNFCESNNIENIYYLTLLQK
jgi:hypothetical protein